MEKKSSAKSSRQLADDVLFGARVLYRELDDIFGHVSGRLPREAKREGLLFTRMRIAPKPLDPDEVMEIDFSCRRIKGMGRYVVVVDDDIDPTDLNEVIWAIGTRSNPEKDIDIMRNSYSSPLDPIYPDQGKIFFGSRAVIDACKPYDWIGNFPKVVQSSPEQKQQVIEKWPEIFK